MLVVVLFAATLAGALEVTANSSGSSNGEGNEFLAMKLAAIESIGGAIAHELGSGRHRGRGWPD